LAVSRPDARPVTWIGALLLELVEIEEGDIATIVIGSGDKARYGVYTPSAPRHPCPLSRHHPAGVMRVHPRIRETSQVAHHRLAARISGLVRAIREGDDATIEAAVVRLSRSRRWLAPLALTVSALVLLVEGLRLVFSNWRLTLLQALPAMWIWVAMLDLKLHVLKGRSFHVIEGPLAWVAVGLVVIITAACFYLNAVVAFAITSPEGPAIRPAMARARSHLGVILGSGAVVGLALGFAAIVVTRYRRPWFALTMSTVIGVMMVCYLAVPSRIIGVKPMQSRRDKLVTGAVSGALGAVVCTPPYLLGRIGLLMLGSHVLFIPGVVLMALGFTLQAGATGAVKAIKMSAILLAGSKPAAA
jgi:hypothetical protein